MKEEINSNTIIVGDFNTPLTTMDRSTKQKINKETQTFFFFYNFFFLFVVNFVIHWNKTAMGLHVFPISIPPPTSLSTLSP